MAVAKKFLKALQALLDEGRINEFLDDLKSLLDEENKSKSLEKLEAALDLLTTELRADINDLEPLESAIEAYGDIEKTGLTPEDYQTEKQSAWEEIETALEAVEPEEEEEEPEPQPEPEPEPAPRIRPPRGEAPPPPTIRYLPARGAGGFLRPFGCGEFIRAYLSGDSTYTRNVRDEDGNPLVLPDPARGTAIDDIRAAYKRSLLWENAEDFVAIALERGITLTVEEALLRTPKRLTKMRTHSFHRYFHHLKMLGWVEPTGEEETSYLGGAPNARVERTETDTTMVEVPQPRRFYRLSPKGWAASIEQWSDPLQALYNYPPRQRSSEKKVAKPGTLPRGAARRG